jgi:glutaminase
LDEVWERVGVEPARNSFNLLVQLKYEKGNSELGMAALELLTTGKSIF